MRRNRAHFFTYRGTGGLPGVKVDEEADDEEAVGEGERRADVAGRGLVVDKVALRVVPVGRFFSL